MKLAEKLAIDGFVVSGGSKRAWTSWLVGILDARVIGMIPIVINVLDVDATTRHHWEAMGYFSPALGDYVKSGLIPDQTGQHEGREHDRGPAELSRPTAYEDSAKFVINAVGDELPAGQHEVFLSPAPRPEAVLHVAQLATFNCGHRYQREHDGLV